MSNARLLPLAASALVALASADVQAAVLDDKSTPYDDGASMLDGDLAAKAPSNARQHGADAVRAAAGDQNRAPASLPQAVRNPAGRAPTMGGRVQGSMPRMPARASNGQSRGRGVEMGRSPQSARRPSADRSATARPEGTESHARPTQSTGSPTVTRNGGADRAQRPASSSPEARSTSGHVRASGSSDAVRPAPSHSTSHQQAASRHAAPPAHAPAGGHVPASASSHVHHVNHAAYAPPRWAPSYHRHYVDMHYHYPHWHPAYWSAGVFVYAAPSSTDVIVVHDDDGGGRGGKGTVKERVPARAVDRNGDVAIGVRGGSYMSGYEDGYGGFGDFGLGLAARYRPVESLGFELAWQHHDQTFDDQSERIEQPLSASVELFAFPWTRVSPYVLAGVTWTARSVEDTYWNGATYETATTEDTLFGPHGGLGIEFAVGKNGSVNFEGKYVGYVNSGPDDPSIPAAVQGTMGLNWYF